MGRLLSRTLGSARADYSQGVKLLDLAKENPVDDPRLIIWMASLEAELLRSQARLAEALVANDRVIELYCELKSDAWNEYLPWESKANLYSSLPDTTKLVEVTEQMIECATSSKNHVTATLGLVRLADAHVDAGNYLAAARSAFEALRRARLDHTEDADVAISVASAMLKLFGFESPRLVSLLGEQIHMLTVDRGPSGELDLIMARAAALRDGGSLRQAADLLEEARRIAADSLPEQVFDVDARRAGLAADLGEAADGAERGLALLDDPRVRKDLWSEARLLTNAAMALLEVTDAVRASALAERARGIWERIGHERAWELTWVIESESQRQRGNLTAAAAALEHAQVLASQGYEVFQLRIRAELARSMGDVTDAATWASQAFEAAEKYQSRHETCSVGTLAARNLIADNRFLDADKVLRAVQVQVESMRHYADWKCSEIEREAEQHGARAVSTLVTGYGDRTARVRSSREHLMEAVRLDPSECWFRVELGLLEALDRRFDRARKHIDDAVERAGTPWLQAALPDLKGGFGA